MKPIFENEKGFTIAELLTVIVMIGILTTAIARFLIVHNRLSNVEQQVGFMQKNLRSAMEILKRDVMNAGNGVPSRCEIDPLIPGDGHGGSADSVVVVGNFNNQSTTLFENEETDNIIHVMDASGFYVGGRLYIKDFYGSEFHTVTSIRLNTTKEDEITTVNPLSRDFHKDQTLVSPVSRVSYTLDRSVADHPKLMRNVKGYGAKILAENIEDIQFTYVLSDGSETPRPSDISDVRIVKIMITARTDGTDCELGGDGYRRRTLESEVKPRNLGS